MYLNKAIIYGNLTRDPEGKVLPSGMRVTTFSLATNSVWRDKTGAKKEDTQFHNIVVFGQAAEAVATYLKKGSTALVEGRIQTRSWDAADGVKKYRTEIVADRVQFGPRPGGAGQTPVSSATTGGNSTGEEAKAPAAELGTINYPEEEINPDDIPF